MASETLEEFYKNKFDWLPDNLQQNIGHFNVFRIEDCIGPKATKQVTYNRRSFYKISLMHGDNIIHYADQSIKLSGASLMFFSPHVPYTFEHMSDNRTGFFCIFTEAFFAERFRGGLSELPMFALGAKPVYALTPQQCEYVSGLFMKMLEEINTSYDFKYELIRNYVTELAYYALKTQPSENLYKHANAKSRITSVFTELLERQFPIETPSQRFMLRSANDFAQRLSVHVNHLNRAIRETTGKTTTDHIAERLLNEAKSLLRHTDWNVSEIGYCLGFEEPTHFNNFFKKQTQQTPTSFRNVDLV
ncbi:helix-turn-helix domain-containing protein [Mucilaginibacter aquaedulcis]|uniref:helix-turn-helix domain-containing protein n=1 Tax=Mucilaginibacter aquaedulcis TaxID=1187081 RepID=UPI0025B28BF1|nr:AraC family transcriptional regulator [Mucilaginibacter aquaedulcis]MDN3550413.1 helix-turn-helix transcriptional regulator [Mucilaginibacter aquaedulcis]